MRLALTLCICWLSFIYIEARGLQVEEIIITGIYHDEPPSTPAPPFHILRFAPADSGLISMHYKIGNTNVGIDPMIIANSTSDTLMEWISQRKQTFNIDELINNIRLQHVKMVATDSFTTCRSYRQTSTVIIGGYVISVLIKNDRGEVFSYTHDSSMPDDFDIRSYLTLFPSLVNKLPESHPAYELFSESSLLEVLEDYSEMIRCEDYYYQEFVKANPARTPQQNRTREGWDFGAYLKQMEKKQQRYQRE